MLVIQHIWHRWDKASRGGDRKYQRPVLERVYPLPEMAPVANPQQQALVHVVAADMFREEPVVAWKGSVAHEDWAGGGGGLDWRIRDGRAEITLDNPSKWRLQTKWPHWLPTPLFVLGPGETARIEWNGRFRTSLFGSNRSSYFEQHLFWLAVTEAPHARLFLDATPRKDIDYTTHIY